MHFAEYTWSSSSRDSLRSRSDSMLSKLVNDASGPDGLMTVREAATNGTLLLTAGHDSTVNTITHCILTVLRNLREPSSLLRNRPELIPGAIEEVAAARIGGPVLSQPGPQPPTSRSVGRSSRRVRRSTSSTAAANRDPKKFPNPNNFDPERRNNEHMGWGSGIHTCFGGPLARLEMNIAFGYLHPSREKSAPRGRSTGVSAKQCLPRPGTPVHRLRRDQRLRDSRES